MKKIPAAAQVVPGSTLYCDGCNALAIAVASAAIQAGIIDGTQPLTGPQLVMLCDGLANSIAALREALAGLERVVVCSECPNQGFYQVGYEQVRCEFCYAHPDSLFNLKLRDRAALEQARLTPG